MVRAGNHSWPDCFREPDTIDEVTDFGRDAGQVAISYPEPFAVGRMQPNRVALRDFVQPLGRAAASMDQRWQTKSRQEAELAGCGVELPPMNVAFDVTRQRL